MEEKMSDPQVKNKYSPKNLQDCFIILKSWLLEDPSGRARREFMDCTEKDLISYHFSLGRIIRNEFGLWHGNTELVKSLGFDHADDCSQHIIVSFWKHLHQENKQHE